VKLSATTWKIVKESTFSRSFYKRKIYENQLTNNFKLNPIGFGNMQILYRSLKLELMWTGLPIVRTVTESDLDKASGAFWCSTLVVC